MSERPGGEFRFCPYCGASLERRTADDRERGVCAGCGYVAYRNPTVGVAVVVRRGDEVLLGLRRGSYADMWCIPCGHVEWDEDVREAAVREFEEETGLRVRLGEVLAVHSNFHHPTQRTVGVWFSGEVIEGEPLASDDLTEVRFFPLDGLPEPLAFPTDRLVLAQLRATRNR
jgi:8-oxo-dGTP diphosphatase